MIALVALSAVASTAAAGDGAAAVAIQPGDAPPAPRGDVGTDVDPGDARAGGRTVDAPQPVAALRPDKSPTRPTEPTVPEAPQLAAPRKAPGPGSPEPRGDAPSDPGDVPSEIAERTQAPPRHIGGKVPCDVSDTCPATKRVAPASGGHARHAPHSTSPLGGVAEAAGWAFATIATGASVGAALAWRLGRLGALAAKLRGLVPLGWRIDEEALRRHPARRRMLAHLAENPGATSRELGAVSGVGYNRVVYHLDMLQRGGLVRVHRQGRRKRFFLADAPRIDPSILQVRDLSDPTSNPGRILALLQHVPGLSLSMVARRLALSPGHAHYHMTRLAEAGLVERLRRGRRVRHYLTDTGHKQAPPMLPEAPAPVSDGVSA